MADFKPSLGYLAMTNKCGILPMYLHGTHDAMPKGRYLPKRGERVAAYVGPFLSYEDVAKLARRAQTRSAQYRAITLPRRERRSAGSRRATPRGRSATPARRRWPSTLAGASGEPTDGRATRRRTHEDRPCSSPAPPASSASTCAACSSSRATSCAGSRARGRAVLDDLGVEHVRGDVLAGDELDRALDGVSAVFHLAGAVSRDPDDGQRMMRLHVDGTRRVLDRMAAAGVRRMVLASTSGTIGVSKRRGDPRRERAVRRGDRRRLAVLRLEDLPGAARVRARRAARHRGRRGQSEPAARPRRSPAVVDRRRAQVPQAPDPDDSRRRHQLRRRARRRAPRPRTRSSRAAPASATCSAARTGRRRSSSRGSAASRTSRRRGSSCRRAGTSWGAVARRGALPLARQGAAGRPHLASRWPSTTGGSTRARPQHELGFAPRDPQLTLVDTVELPAPGRRSRA